MKEKEKEEKKEEEEEEAVPNRLLLIPLLIGAVSIYFSSCDIHC